MVSCSVAVLMFGLTPTIAVAGSYWAGVVGESASELRLRFIKINHYLFFIYDVNTFFSILYCGLI